jgi:hypothetical protein
MDLNIVISYELETVFLQWLSQHCGSDIPVSGIIKAGKLDSFEH